MTYPWTTWIDRALDGAEWQANRARTDIAYAVEYGYAFIGSSRWEVSGGASDYVQVVIPSTTVMRVYDRIIAVDGGRWELDVLEVSDITDGNVGFYESPLNTRIGREPTVQIRRGSSDPTIVQVREESMIPSQRGPRSSGAIQKNGIFRHLNGLMLALRVTNTDNRAHTINMEFVWTEEVSSD